MAEYIGIKGISIPTLSSDPSNPIVGQVWYNTSGDLKGYGAQGAGAWASGPTMGTGRYFPVGIGTSTAALSAGGNSGVGSEVAIVESYNGSAWTEVGDMTNARKNSSGSAGTQTAALMYGTSPVSALVEQYNGTGWTEVGDLNTPRGYGSASSAGTTTAALCFGGTPSPPGPSAPPGSTVNEEYNGTAWTEVGDLNFGRFRATGAGTSTAALASGDGNAPEENKTEAWNGTAWTAVADINEGGYAMAGAGTQTAAWVMGGTPPAKRRPGGNSATEHYNGTSWTEVADVSTALEGPGGAGTTTAGLGFAGYLNPGYSDASFEWSLSDATKTFTAT